MKKIISLLGCCFIAISTLTACENNNLPAWADTDVLTPKAQTMIDTLNMVLLKAMAMYRM